MTLEKISLLVTQHTGFSINALRGKNRIVEMVFARKLFCYLAQKAGHSSIEVGKFLNRDHSTVIHSYKSAENIPKIMDIFKSLGESVEPIIKLPGISQQNQRKYRHIYERFGGKCFVCGFSSIVEICHIKPRYLGGSDDPSNILLLCPNHHSMFDSGLLILKDINIPLFFPQG